MVGDLRGIMWKTLSIWKNFTSFQQTLNIPKSFIYNLEQFRHLIKSNLCGIITFIATSRPIV